MKRYLTEFIGTFFLVLTIGFMSVNEMSRDLRQIVAPLAIGCTLMIMVYMGGHVSGGHYNPAVSLAVLLRGRLPIIDFVPYVVAQLLGAFAAATMMTLIRDQTFAVQPPLGFEYKSVLIVEALITFALALVVLNVATAKKTEGNSFYGLAIGFTVVVGAYTVGAISGGAFNPAVGTGPTLWSYIGDNAVPLSNIWIYWVGPCVGALAAALVFGIQEW